MDNLWLEDAGNELDLGEDGHTASIFPRNRELMRSDKLREVSKHPKSGQRRITVNGAVIARARFVEFIVTGGNKEEQVVETIEGTGGFRAYPACLVQSIRDDVQWWLDRDSASLLAGTGA